MAHPSLAPRPTPGRLRGLFVNENLGGHATLHQALERLLAPSDRIEAEFLEVPAPSLVRRIVAAPVPGLDRLDLDLHALRYQLAQSRYVRTRLRRARGSYDVVHAYSQSAVLGCERLLQAGPSVVSTDATAAQNLVTLPQRSPTRFSEVSIRAVQWFERRVFAAATLVVAQSEWAAQSLRETAGVDDDRLRVIPFGIVPFDLPRHREAEGLPQVTFVGYSMGRKGGWRLLRAFRRALRGRCVVNLVTREPDVRNEPGVRVFSDFVPGDRRLAALLAQTAVFAFPSEIDKSPYSVLEAMLAGVPVVAARSGAVPEMVVDGETGLLIDTGASEEELAAAIGRLLDDPHRRRAMGEAARRRAQERFDARRTTAALLESLEEAWDRFHGRPRNGHAPVSRFAMGRRAG